MKVFVVIVTYNSLKNDWIKLCLDSVRKSTISSRIIVVDNASKDDTVNFIKLNYLDVILIENKKNLGFGAANNIGIKKACELESDYVFLLNQDAWTQPGTIEKLITAQKQEPEFGIVSPMHLNGKGTALDYNFSLFINPSMCNNLYSDVFLNKTKNSIYELDFVNAAAWLISRDCMEKVGGFNPSFFHYGEDNNYLQRVKYHSLKVGILPTSIIYHDRETRTENIYFKDEIVLYKRKIILKASNPFHNFNFKTEYKIICKTIIKTIIFLRIEEFQKNMVKIKILNKLNRTVILKNREQSKLEKPSFLN